MLAAQAKGVKKASCVEMSGRRPGVFYSQSLPLDTVLQECILCRQKSALLFVEGLYCTIGELLKSDSHAGVIEK